MEEDNLVDQSVWFLLQSWEQLPEHRIFFARQDSHALDLLGLRFAEASGIGGVSDSAIPVAGPSVYTVFGDFLFTEAFVFESRIKFGNGVVYCS